MSPLSPSDQETLLRRIRDIPSLPEVVTRILAVIGRPETPASEIARLIAYDPGLTSKVLRMVNSAAYGFQRQISSIQHGVMILGFGTVRGLVLSASIFRLFKGHAHPGGLNHRKFWEHSLTTAVAARMLAQRLRLPDADDIFSAAMLHDIGKVVLDTYFPDYGRLLAEARQQHLPFHGSPFYNLEESLLGITHAGIGGLLAGKWKLPLEMAEVIQYHHQPDRAESCPQAVHLVALANEMAILQLASSGVYQEGTITPATAEFFNLDESALELLFRGLKDEMHTAHELLDSISIP
jgi:putative nucleotidyltransferase with HDIG domain